MQEEDKIKATKMQSKSISTTMNVENSKADRRNTYKFNKVARPLFKISGVTEEQQKQYEKSKGQQ